VNARRRAEEARRTAGFLGRPTETLLAGLVLERALRAVGEEAEAGRLRQELREVPLAGVAASARQELEALVAQKRSGAAETGTETSGEANRP
jgi:hypothetical protein